MKTGLASNLCVATGLRTPIQNKGRKAMSNEKKQNLQDTFLNSVRKSKTPLTIFLVNGVKLQGVVTWFRAAVGAGGR